VQDVGCIMSRHEGTGVSFCNQNARFRPNNTRTSNGRKEPKSSQTILETQDGNSFPYRQIRCFQTTSPIRSAALKRLASAVRFRPWPP
jgi:hypothetical protein